MQILIVDDEPDILHFLSYLLRARGYEVLEASNGVDCLRLAAEKKPDLILLDVVLPDVDGIEVCRRIKSNPELSDIFIIHLSARRTSINNQVEGLEAGADGYITKPVDPDELLARVKAMARIRKAEEKIREQAALLDIAQDAIIVCNLEGDIVFWNRAAELLYEKNAEEIIGENARRILFSGAQTKFSEARNGVIEKGEWSGELRRPGRADRDVIIESRWKLVRDDQGKPKTIFIVNTDITEKKHLQEQILRAQRMESIGTLASGIAHDLNNILAPTLLSIQILKSKLPGERDQQMLDSLEHTTRRGADLVKQVLSYARGFEGERTLFQMRHIIFDIERIIKETFPKSIRVITNSPEDLWLVSGDTTQLHQVLMNLSVNARDAMSDGGELIISAENFFIDENYARLNIEAKIGPYVLISVSDSGTGIPREFLDRVFDPFFTTKEVGKGTGLGLSTVSGIVRSHGGFVTVNSEMGKGTHFKIYLPAKKSKETDQDREKMSQLPLGNGETILIIDDEPSIREVTKTSLEAYGYKVLLANDGIEAVALYAEHKNEVEVVLLDMIMPIMDGPLTIRALRKINPEVRIIAASGLLASEKVEESTRMGVKKFLLKPYTTEELLKAIQEVLSPPPMRV